MGTVNCNYALNEDMQTLEQLWESIHKLAGGRVRDNALGEEYPLETRIRQTLTLKVLVEVLEKTHEKALHEVLKN